MGRQVEFYFRDEDERKFLALPQLEDVECLRIRGLRRPSNVLLEKLHAMPYGEASSKQTAMCLKPDLRNIRYDRLKSHRYLLDVICSPVIEYSRAGYRAKDNKLIWGRIWYQHKYWDKDEDGNDILVSKSEELLKLYESLARWLRKFCKRLPDGMYIAPGADELHEKGAKLS